MRRPIVIYIPGLGDRLADKGLRGKIIRRWRIWGVEPHLHTMFWGDDVPYQTKFDGLLQHIDELAKSGEVSLIGESAGATAAVNAYAARPETVRSVVFLAGKVNNPQAIGTGYKRRNPAFWESAQHTTDSLAQLTAEQRDRMLSIYATVDPVVPKRDSIIPGAHNRQTWSMGHATTIALQLIFGAPRFLRFIKQQKQP